MALLVGDSVIPLERAGGPTRQWPTRSALVLCCAGFLGLPSTIPSVEDLVDWGLTPELARHLRTSATLLLLPLTPTERLRLIRQFTAEFRDAYSLFGYSLVVSDEAQRHVGEHTSENAGVPGALAPLAATADRGLARLVRESAPPGSRYVLAPDDTTIPEARGMWRE